MTLTQILQKIRSAFYTKAETDAKLNVKAKDSDVVHKSGNETVNGTKTFTSETVNTSPHAFRHIFGDYGTFWRQDGTDLYLMLTNSGDPYGDWNNFRPLAVNLATGICNINGAAYPKRVDGVTMNFNWNGQGGQPSWLWGGEDGVNMHVYNPSNFSVNYAKSSGNADTVDGSHAWQMQTLSADGKIHGSVNWLLQCQHKADGESYFKLYVGDKSIGTKVDRANSAAYAERSANNGAFYISGYKIYVE